MAGNIKGIIVEIGGDTSGLQKALKDVNSKTASLSKELRGINSLLKLDPKNTELLAQKQTVLKENIKQTTKRLENLKEAQRRFIESGGNLNSAEYRNLQREIIKTESNVKQLKLEASNWTKVSRSLSEISSKMKSLGDTISNIGRNLTTKLTVPIVSLGTLATKSAIDFESAFAGVEKTVDGTAEQMKSLKQGIKNMAKEIPSTTAEISAVAEAAGQLGIQTDNVLDFTKTMINMGNATNLSADEAATTLARFANITKMSQKDFDKLGSVIVALGNNFATTEAEISAMGMNLASAGTQVGMSQSEIMALATALSSVGLEAQAGGTAFSKVMVNMQLAVEKGGKNLKNFASVAGMSSKNFQKAFKEDATKAIMAFVEGLSKSGERGKSAIKILDDMDIKETRLRDALLRSANASNIMNKAIELGNKEWKENTALTNEANKRYETLKSKIQIAKNKLTDIGITLGNIIMPYVEKFINKISALTEKFSRLSPKTQEMIVKIGAMVAVIGPLLLIIGKIISLGGSIIGVFSKVTSIIGGLTTGTGALSAAMTVLTGPIGLVIGAVVAATGAFALLWNKSETFRNSIKEIGKSIIRTYNEHIKPTINNIKAILTELWNGIIKPLASYLWKKFSPIIEAVFVTAGKIIAAVFDKVAIIIKGITGVLKGLIQFISGVFSKDWSKAWEGVRNIFGSVFEGLKALFKAPINWIISGINKFISGINKVKVPDWVPGVGGKGINIPMIPKLAKGGIVDEATLTMIGEGKSAEAVIPLDRTLTKYMAEAMRQAGGTRSVVVNFYPQKMTEAELDRAFNYIDRRLGMAY